MGYRNRTRRVFLEAEPANGQTPVSFSDNAKKWYTKMGVPPELFSGFNRKVTLSDVKTVCVETYAVDINVLPLILERGYSLPDIRLFLDELEDENREIIDKWTLAAYEKTLQ